MFPIRDNIPRVHRPYAVWALIVANSIVFLITVSMPDRDVALLFHTLGVVPARFSDPVSAASMGYPPFGAYAFVSYMFLHGSWMHFIVNMWTLWIFADNIEDVMGPLRFLMFYLLSGLAALGAHMAFNLASPVPVVGASGAIAGVMGAYFLLYPHARVITVIPIIIIPFIIEVPALAYLGVWFLSQFFSGVFSAISPEHGGGIAWWAHAGGFLAGMLLLPFFRRKGRCYFCRIPEGDPTSVSTFRRR
ncbi:membrane associated rhomboid family serine protease [Desulfobaculum xiamenense]|uniref:Membrane associated rhomboid family serine protease n=1 Tax=Desulfobaculum xiamenense TaxID=995050 RepID=A0A846QGC2_9BACT|nr:rhomboid family intramembrane serine protease [Desulfobaculum xiamenense]NJB67348.1 membrane associated rhomboid family serine protease [Desulfobaculum xiamenense]